MKVVFMGTPDFAVATVDATAKAGHEIVMVVTQQRQGDAVSGSQDLGSGT